MRYSFDRYFLAPVTLAGDTILFYTDTGGGANMMYEHAVEALNLQIEQLPLGTDTARVVAMPAFRHTDSIPPPPPIGPYDKKLLVFKRSGFSGHGFLGRLWFATRIWEFDYPGKSLAIISDIDWANRPADHRIPLGFQVDSSGAPTTYFPRITIAVDGDSIELLFDTGASASLTEHAASQLNIDERGGIGISFIAESVFKKWQAAHPDWQVIENADKTLNMPMIKVPKITIANYEVGPVWFTMRPDKNFTEYMSQWMDKKIEGAIGGSALKYFRIIVDYPKRVAEFRIDQLRPGYIGSKVTQ